MRTIFTCKRICKNGKICKRSKLKNETTCLSHKERENCVICSEKINNKKTLECNHTFCKPCISKWLFLEQKRTCPLCRDLVTNVELYDAFEFCLKQNYIATIVYNEYYIENQELINHLLLADTESFHSYVNETEWKEVINHIKLDQVIFDLFINSEYIITSNYIKVNESENEQNFTTINGRKFIYKYKINVI